MNVELSKIIKKGETIAVAVSGGSDSMALLYYMHSIAEKYGVKVIALNVEHGIRKETSKADSEFVRSFCRANGIELLSYSIDSIKKAKSEKLSVEQAARILRYECFFSAINEKKCDKVATAHHQRDNVESVLINLFRGTGLKGVSGINTNYEDKIIRPFLSVTKEEIMDYVAENSIPYVTDETNFSDDYTRNYVRLKVLPVIKEIFPKFEESISRFSEIAKAEDEYLDIIAKEKVKVFDGGVKIALPCHPVIFARAAIFALKYIGLEKDWEKKHVDGLYKLTENKNSASFSLPKKILAVKEYDKIVIFKEPAVEKREIPFSVGKTEFGEDTIEIEQVSLPKNFKDGFYADLDKIPDGAIIRTKRDGDVFTKFGSGSKKLNDYFTDIKIPIRKRNSIPVIAKGNTVYFICGIAISELVRVDKNTKNIIQLKYQPRG